MRKVLQLLVIFTFSAISFTANAQILRIEDCAIKQYNAEGKVEKIFCDPEPCPVYFHQEPRRVLVVLSNGVILDWDEKGQFRKVFCIPEDKAIRIFPEGHNYLVETRNGKVYVYSRRGNYKGEYESSGRHLAERNKKDKYYAEKLLTGEAKLEPASKKQRADSWWRRDEEKRPVFGFIKLNQAKKAKKDELKLRQARLKEKGGTKESPLVDGKTLVESRQRQTDSRRQVVESKKAEIKKFGPQANRNVDKSIPGGPKTMYPTAEQNYKAKIHKGKPRVVKTKPVPHNTNPKQKQPTAMKPKVKK